MEIKVKSCPVGTDVFWRKSYEVSFSVSVLCLMAKYGNLPVVSFLQHISYVSVPACPDPPDWFLSTL